MSTNQVFGRSFHHTTFKKINSIKNKEKFLTLLEEEERNKKRKESFCNDFFLFFNAIGQRNFCCLILKVCYCFFKYIILFIERFELRNKTSSLSCQNLHFAVFFVLTFVKSMSESICY